MTTTPYAAALNLLTTLEDTGNTNGQMVGTEPQHQRWREHAKSLGFTEQETTDMAAALPLAIGMEWVHVHVSRAGQKWHRLTVQGRRLV